MSEQRTGHPPTAVGEQLPDLRAATWLATAASEMPPVRITVDPTYQDGARVDVRRLSELEQWRDHLALPPTSVTLHAYPGSVWLSMRLTIASVPVDLVCDVDLPYGVAVRTPGEDAERRRRAEALTQQPSPIELGQAEAAEWNAAHPVGTPVAAYPLTHEDEPLLTRTRSEAWPLGHGGLVVLVEGYSGGICLTHVDVRDVAEPPAAGAPAEPLEVRTLADAQGGGA